MIVYQCLNFEISELWDKKLQIPFIFIVYFCPVAETSFPRLQSGKTQKSLMKFVDWLFSEFLAIIIYKLAALFFSVFSLLATCH